LWQPIHPSISSSSSSLLSTPSYLKVGHLIALLGHCGRTTPATTSTAEQGECNCPKPTHDNMLLVLERKLISSVCTGVRVGGVGGTLDPIAGVRTWVGLPLLLLPHYLATTNLGIVPDAAHSAVVKGSHGVHYTLISAKQPALTISAAKTYYSLWIGWYHNEYYKVKLTD
jgi:hypothetical protein